MRLILAIFLPWLTFFTIDRPFSGLICLLLQLIGIGESLTAPPSHTTGHTGHVSGGSLKLR